MDEQKLEEFLTSVEDEGGSAKVKRFEFFILLTHVKGYHVRMLCSLHCLSSLKCAILEYTPQNPFNKRKER